MPSSSRKARKKMTHVLVPVSGSSSVPSAFLCSEELALPFGNGTVQSGEGMGSWSAGRAAGKIGPDHRRTGSGVFTPDGQQRLAAAAVRASRAANQHPMTDDTGHDTGRMNTFGEVASAVTPSEPSSQPSRSRIKMPNAFASVSLFSGETYFGDLSTSSDEVIDSFSDKSDSPCRKNTVYYRNRIPPGATATDGNIGSSSSRRVGPGQPDAPALVLVEDEETWKSRFIALCLYKSQHGHCLVSHDPRQSNPSRTSLAMWVGLCREEYEMLGMPNANIRMLTQERIDMLDSIDFEWNVKLLIPGGIAPPDATNTRSRNVRPMLWDGKYGELLQFKWKYGDANVPAGWAANPDLAEWVVEQRRDYRRYTLADFCSLRGITEEQIGKLERIGFQWSETTPDNADAAADREPRRPHSPPQKQYSSTTAHRDSSRGVPTVSPSPMKAENSARETSSIAAPSRKSNRQITPVITPIPTGDTDSDVANGPYGHRKGESQTSWDKHFDQLLQYGEKNGTYNVSKSYKGGDLYDWVQYQRVMFYRGEDEGRGKLGPGQRVRFDKLNDSLIFVRKGDMIVDKLVEGDDGDKSPSSGRSWDQSLALLKRHFEEIGDVDIYYIADPDLYHWTNTVMIQYLEMDVDMDRSAISEKPLSDARYKKLKNMGIGSDWSHNEKLWHIMFHKLSKFELENGHCEVPGSNATQLGLWIYRQRYSLAAFIANGMRSTSFTHKRKAKLDGIGFDWREYDKGYIDPDEDDKNRKDETEIIDQEEKKEDDADFIDFNGARMRTLAERLGLPSGYTGKDIDKYSNECPNCHQTFKSDGGLKYHIDNDVCNKHKYTSKAPMDHNDKLWEENFSALCSYKKKYGNLEGGRGDDPLCKWAKRQRYECREWISGLHTRFNVKRKGKLDRIGFDFKGYDGKPISTSALEDPRGIGEVTSADHQWNQSFFSLVEFKTEHGHLEGITPINEVLGRWVYKQRYNLRSLITGKSKSNFSAEKKEVLDSIDFDWQGYDKGWEKWKRASTPRKATKTTPAAALPEKAPCLAASIDVPKGGACPGCKQVFHSKSGWVCHVKNGVCGVHACTRCRAVFKTEKNLRNHEQYVECQPWTYEHAKLEALNAIMDAPSTPDDANVVFLDEGYKFDNCCECGVLERPGDQMLLCDRCNLACHLECTHDNLTEIPENDWFCHNCMSKADKLDYCCECGIMEKPDGPPMLLCDGCDICCHVKCTHDCLAEVPEDEWFCRKCTAKRNIRLGDALAVENYAPPSFEDLLKKLKRFRAENGHFDVPPELEELHHFAAKLRESYLKRRKTALQLEHEEQLDKIGFNWPAMKGSSAYPTRLSPPFNGPSSVSTVSGPKEKRFSTQKRNDRGSDIDSESKEITSAQRKNCHKIILIGPPKRDSHRPPEYCGAGVSHGERQPSWNSHFDQLLQYGEKNGTYNVSKSYKGGDLYDWVQYQRYLFYKGEREGRSKGLGPAQRERYDKLKEAEIFIPLDDAGGGRTKRKRAEIDSSESDSASCESEESSALPSQKRWDQNLQQITLVPPPKKGNPKPPTYNSDGNDGVNKGESQTSWNEHLQELLKYGSKNGTYIVSKSYKGGDLYRWLQHQKWMFFKGEYEGRSKGLGPGQRERYDKLKKADIFSSRDK